MSLENGTKGRSELVNPKTQLVTIAQMVENMPKQFGVLIADDLVLVIRIMRRMSDGSSELIATKAQWIAALNMFQEEGLVTQTTRKKVIRTGVETHPITNKYLDDMWEVLESEYPKSHYPQLYQKLKRLTSRLLSLDCKEIDNMLYVPLRTFIQLLGNHIPNKIESIIRQYLEEYPQNGINGGVKLKYLLVVYVMIKQQTAKKNHYIWNGRTVELDTTKDINSFSVTKLEHVQEHPLKPVQVSYTNCLNKLGSLITPAIASKHEFNQRTKQLVGYEINGITWLPLSEITKNFLQDYKLSHSSGLILTSNSKNDPHVSQMIQGERCINSDYLLFIIYSLVNRLGMDKLKLILFTL